MTQSNEEMKMFFEYITSSHPDIMRCWAEKRRVEQALIEIEKRALETIKANELVLAEKERGLMSEEDTDKMTHCPICFDEYDKYTDAIVYCENGHVAACSSCIEMYTRHGTDKKCPICRRPDTIPIIEIARVTIPRRREYSLTDADSFIINHIDFVLDVAQHNHIPVSFDYGFTTGGGEDMVWTTGRFHMVRLSESFITYYDVLNKKTLRKHPESFNLSTNNHMINVNPTLMGTRTIQITDSYGVIRNGNRLRIGVFVH